MPKDVLTYSLAYLRWIATKAVKSDSEDYQTLQFLLTYPRRFVLLEHMPTAATSEFPCELKVLSLSAPVKSYLVQ